MKRQPAIDLFQSLGDAQYDFRLQPAALGRVILTRTIFVGVERSRRVEQSSDFFGLIADAGNRG